MRHMKITDEMVRIAKSAWSKSIIDTAYDIEERREIGIRAALESVLTAAAEPVAWRVYKGGRYDVFTDKGVASAGAHFHGSKVEPLYTLPPITVDTETRP